MPYGLPQSGGVIPQSSQPWSDYVGPRWQNRQHRAGGGHATPGGNSVSAAAAVLDVQDSRAGALQLTTDDGDKSNHIVRRPGQTSRGSLQGSSNGTNLAYGSTTLSQGISVSVSVDGSLDSGEVADITKLLGQLAQGVSDPSKNPTASDLGTGGALESLNAFSMRTRNSTKPSFPRRTLPRDRLDD